MDEVNAQGESKFFGDGLSLDQEATEDNGDSFQENETFDFVVRQVTLFPLIPSFNINLKF